MIVNRTPVLVPRGDLSSGMTAAQLDMLLQYELYWAWDDDSNQGALYISEDNTLKKIGIKYGTFTTLANGLVPASTTADKRYLGADGAWHGVFSTGNMGLVPAPSSGDSGKYLRSDGTWQTVSGGGTTYSTLSQQAHSATTQYVINGSGNNTSYFLRGDGTWQKVPWSMISNAPNFPYGKINIEGPSQNDSGLSTSAHLVKDHDGNVYHEVQIGGQIWLIEPYHGTTFEDCTEIQNGCPQSYPPEPTYVSDDADGVEAFYYSSGVVESISQNGSLVPGFHIPTHNELLELKTYLDCHYGNSSGCIAENEPYWEGSSPEIGSPAENPSNEAGLTVHPCGYYNCSDDERKETHENAQLFESDGSVWGLYADLAEMQFAGTPQVNGMFQIYLIKDKLFSGNYNDLTNKPDLFNFNTEIFKGEFDGTSIKVYKQNSGTFTSQQVQNLSNKRIMVRVDTNNEPYGHPINEFIDLRFMTGASTYISNGISCGWSSHLGPEYYGSNILNPIFTFVINSSVAYFVGLSCNRSKTYIQSQNEISSGKYKISVGTANKYYTISSSSNITLSISKESNVLSGNDIGIVKILIINTSGAGTTINANIERSIGSGDTTIDNIYSTGSSYVVSSQVLLTIEMTNTATAFVRDEYFLTKLS